MLDAELQNRRCRISGGQKDAFLDMPLFVSPRIDEAVEEHVDLGRCFATRVSPDKLSVIATVGIVDVSRSVEHPVRSVAAVSDRFYDPGTLEIGQNLLTLLTQRVVLI